MCVLKRMGKETPMKLNHYTVHHKLTISVVSSMGGMMDFEDTGTFASCLHWGNARWMGFYVVSLWVLLII